ncbi:type II CAAX prenyl endopeptidase Rce1 family protein [Micrococcus sp. FDAARGOS_333]|uniref:CPBP family glutamic-type intramembrane protease n=1 Tax=Micrococcus sp. FDAARGOS_333 TaxID=1930558 RepID=UPI001D1031B6|nr:CPBP family glutamic-type intramembrane protease [Micrococcus sp. FDAARGOS_333]
MFGDPSLDSLAAYLIDVAPGLLLVVAALAVVPGRMVAARVLVAILGVVLLRDAMVGHGLFTFGTAGDRAVLWLRFTSDPIQLISLSVLALAAVAGLVAAFRQRSRGMRWTADRAWLSGPVGLLGAAVIVLPFAVLYGSVPALSAGLGFGDVPLDARGGGVAAGILVPLLVFAFCAGLLVEVLFRGLLQSELEHHTTVARSALASAAVFAACHVFLASTVTEVGWPILAFTLVEGLVCAAIAIRHGVLGSTIAHGGALFLLASGLV